MFKKKRALMKESRLFQMLYYILECGRVTATELADKFEISVRTVYRDIDWISNAGIPIYTIQGKGGGIEIDKSFILDKSMLTGDEKEQIMIALNNANGLNDIGKDNLISKLSTLFNIKNNNWVEVDSSNWQNADMYRKLFEKIKCSIINKRIISFDYSSGKSETISRIVKPVRLVFKGWSWYLYAFCKLRNDFRFFKLSRIKDIKINDEIYNDNFNDIIINKELKYEKTIHVKLKFDKNYAYRVYDEFHGNVIDKENSLIAEIDLPDNNMLYSYILSFGEGVEVLEPEELRIKLKNILEKMQNNYRT